MRIPSGVTDQVIYFVAVDATDLKTRETGLASFTVYRSRNGGTATAYTTPTITEVSSGNMPGVYKFLLDEDMTIDSGDQSQEVCLHITHAGMAPVTRIFELYRPSVTAGETVGVSSGAVSNVTTVNGLASGVITATSIASGALTAAKFAAGAFDAVWSVTTRLLTAGTNIALAKGTGVTGFNDLDASGIRTAVGLSSANLDTQISGINTNIDANETKIDTANSALVTIDSIVDSIVADTNELQTDWANGGRLDLILDSAASAGDPWATTLPGSYTSGQAGKIIGDNLNDTVSSRASQTTVDDLPTNAELASALSSADDATLAAIAALPSASGIADEVATRTLKSNIKQVNDLPIDGSGTEGDPWGPV